jgi:hypothetical protein
VYPLNIALRNPLFRFESAVDKAVGLRNIADSTSRWLARSFEAALRPECQPQRNRMRVGSGCGLRFGCRARDGGGNAARTTGKEDRLDFGSVQPRIHNTGGGRPKQPPRFLFDHAVEPSACRVSHEIAFDESEIDADFFSVAERKFGVLNRERNAMSEAVVERAKESACLLRLYVPLHKRGNSPLR